MENQTDQIAEAYLNHQSEFAEWVEKLTTRRRTEAPDE